MSVILQFDFELPPEVLGDALTETAQDLAKSITQEEGFIAKIWTENLQTGDAGGLYLFENEASALKYAKMHSARAVQMGGVNPRFKIFTVNKTLSGITSGDQFIRILAE